MPGIHVVRGAVAVAVLAVGFASGCSGGSGNRSDGGTVEDSGTGMDSGTGADSGTSGDGGSCPLTGSWTGSHQAAGGVTIAAGICADGRAWVMDRTGGSVPSAHAEGTFAYDPASGTAALTSTAAYSQDPSFDGCVGITGTYQLTFTDCSHFTLSAISDPCAVRVQSIGSGAVLTRSPLGNGMTCTASGIELSDGGVVQGGDGGVPRSDAGVVSGCTVSLSGAVTKTLTCTVSAVNDGTNTTLSITTPNGGGPGPEFTFTAKIAGVPQTSTSYDWNNSVQQAGTVMESTSAIWQLNSQQNKGSSSVQFSQMTPGAMSGSSTLYSAHGSATATYAPATGGSSDVIATVSF